MFGDAEGPYEPSYDEMFVDADALAWVLEELEKGDYESLFHASDRDIKAAWNTMRAFLDMQSPRPYKPRKKKGWSFDFDR